MPCPVYIDGIEAGTLTETREGLYRVFRADCAMREGLHRLWLHGGGRSVYLGLLTPAGDRLKLEKRFSRAAGLPDQIDCARNSAAAPLPSPAAEPPGALVWHTLPSGALIAYDGQTQYLALPAALSPSSPAAERLRRIGGKDYLVFRRLL